MKTRTSTYPLRLPVSLKNAAEKISAEDGTSMNQFVVVAVAEKVSALTTVAYFEQHKAKADRTAFRRILKRKGGEPPQPADRIPKAAKKK